MEDYADSLAKFQRDCNVGGAHGRPAEWKPVRWIMTVCGDVPWELMKRLKPAR
jgi:hypothetical protein